MNELTIMFPNEATFKGSPRLRSTARTRLSPVVLTLKTPIALLPWALGEHETGLTFTIQIGHTHLGDYSWGW